MFPFLFLYTPLKFHYQYHFGTYCVHFTQFWYVVCQMIPVSSKNSHLNGLSIVWNILLMCQGVVLSAKNCSAYSVFCLAWFISNVCVCFPRFFQFCLKKGGNLILLPITSGQPAFPIAHVEGKKRSSFNKISTLFAFALFISGLFVFFLILLRPINRNFSSFSY